MPQRGVPVAAHNRCTARGRIPFTDEEGLSLRCKICKTNPQFLHGPIADRLAAPRRGRCNASAPSIETADPLR
jgi:hypothetical protein